jgi:hypothetical protein
VRCLLFKYVIYLSHSKGTLAENNLGVMTMMNNKLAVTESKIDQLKNEIANELGIQISPDMTSRDAGRIGGSVTKRLIELGKQNLK